MKKVLAIILTLTLAPPALARLVVIIPPKIKQTVEQKINYLKQIFEELTKIDSKLTALNSKVDSLPISPISNIHADKFIVQQISTPQTTHQYQAMSNIEHPAASAPQNPWQVWNGSKYVNREKEYGY